MTKENTHKTVIGLTGGIASGKTVASDALGALGFSVVDADVISRALTAHGSAVEKEITDMFPCADANGALDRKALRAVIAADPAAREKLNAFLHPHIISAVKAEVAAARSPVVLSAPLLFETGLDRLCGCTVCVVCPREKRIERVILRDGTDRQSAAAVVDMQTPDEARAAAADYVLSSDTDLDKFKSAVAEMFLSIAEKFGAAPRTD
ncbi:MAG: dephospho-CoA kinase [Roseburia sp.]|nr:dephospho-CoA kinase [Roseburia sp.]